jgi:hypothetical protein
MNLIEEVFRIKNLIFELAPHSSGVDEFFSLVKAKPEILHHLKFKDFKELEQYVLDASYEDFSELQKEVEHFEKRREKYFKSEMDEFQRASQDLSRDEGIDISVEDMVKLFKKAPEVKLDNKVWSKLENTESNEIKKGDMKKVVALAKQYNKTLPSELRKALLSGDYKRPLILKFGNRYHLVAGNTRLCTAAALGLNPQVLVADINSL